MAVAELELSPGLPWTDLRRALARRAVKEQQAAQALLYLKYDGASAEKIQEHLGVEEVWLTRGAALIFEAREALDRELGGGWDLMVGTRATEMPVGRLLLRMQQLATERAEQGAFIACARWVDERMSLRAIKEKMGLADPEFRLALEWLKDAGFELRDD